MRATAARAIDLMTLKCLGIGLIFSVSLICAQSQVIVQKDVTYLEPDRTEKVDIYFPGKDHSSALPAVLLIHGGGWKEGDKADKRGQSISSTLAEAGYIVFAVNYKLSGKADDRGNWKAAWPQNLYDCKSALRFIRKNAKQFGVDPNRIAVMGESAGGHLALLLGATEETDILNRGGLYTEQSNKVSCVIDMYGIPDLIELSHVRDWVAPHFAGSGPAATLENMRIASPSTYFNSQDPPIMVIHGTDDPTVPYEISLRLVSRLKQLHVPYEFITVPEAGHSFNLQPKQMDLRPAVLDFLRRYLNRQ